MKETGKIVLGALAPHPPHLVYGENPSQNEPKSEGGWDVLRWGYQALREKLKSIDYDVLIVHSPHWRTVVGHHVLAVPHFENLSVDPIFPNLFRYRYKLDVDVELAHAMADLGDEFGITIEKMENQDFRVDYGTITSCHLANPEWDKPILSISSNAAYSYFSRDVGEREMQALAQTTKKAVEQTGRKAVLLASNSLSHRHFTKEPAVPEDMSHEHIYSHNQYLWDMHILKLIRSGDSQAVLDIMPDFIDQATSECDAGCLSWLLHALDVPRYPGKVHSYGTVIGTGNAIVEWDPATQGSAK